MKGMNYSAFLRYAISGRKAFTLIITLFVSATLSAQSPTITSFSPTSAALGYTVVITGTGFTGTTSVKFGGTNASSFSVVSSTQINAVVPSGTTGAITVTNGTTASKNGFYYTPLSGIITDYAGFWSTNTKTNNSVLPDDGHNLLAFTYNGTVFSTGVNDTLLTGQGVSFTRGNFRALPVAGIAGTNNASSIYLSTASKVDGSPTTANTAALAGITIRDVMSDGPHGLNMGTGITNLPASASMSFEINLIRQYKIADAEPDLIITQIAQETSVNDVFQFVDAAGNIVGNAITQDMTLLNKLGTYTLDLFELSPTAPFNSAICFKPYATNTTREIRMTGFKLSDFGITNTNYTQIAALKIIPSGTSDYAFIAYSDALEMSPNIAQFPEQTTSTVCAGGTASLEVITTPAYGGTLSYVWRQSTDNGVTWTTVNNGGSFSGAATKRLVIAAATSGYKYKAVVTESGTNYSAVSSVFTIAYTTATAPTSVTISSATTTCLNTLVSLSGNVTGGSNIFYQWQSDPTGLGIYSDVPGAIQKTYLPPVNATGTINYRLRISGGSGCTPNVTSSPVAVNTVGISSVTNVNRCGIGAVLMTATATSGTISWYTSSIGGMAITTGPTYSPSITKTTTYYVASDVTQCAGGSRVPVTATVNSVVWAGTTTTDWSTIANWDCGGTLPAALPTSLNSVTIPTTPSGGRYPTLTSKAPIYNLTIEPGASMTIGNGGEFEIYGSIINNGTFDATKGTVTFRGSTQQLIGANVFATNTIKNLTINNTAGVLINGPLNITGTYTPTAGVLTTFGNLTLKSDSNGTARVAQGTSNYVSGNVNVERYVPAKRAWRLLTAPVTNSKTIYQTWQNNGLYEPNKGMLVTAPVLGEGIDSIGNASLKRWDIATQTLQAITNTKVPISAGSNGAADNNGYFVFVRGDRKPNNIDFFGIKKNITTLTTTGFLQTGTQTFNNLSAKAGGFTLVGNPYACPIDWNLVLANSNTKNLKRKFYVWDPQLNSVGGYIVMDDVVTSGTFVPTPAGSTQTKYIQSAQAFFVITNTAAAATLEIKESNKATVNNTKIFGRPEGNTTASLLTDLYIVDKDGDILADGTRVDFNEAFSNGIDDNDNNKFSNSNETFGCVRSNTFLATERRQPVITTDTVFYKLTKTTSKTYRFVFTPQNFTGEDVVAYLEDKLSSQSKLVSLKDTTHVEFVVNDIVASQAADRFRLVFTKTNPLPMNFISMKAIAVNKANNIQWKVANELNVKQYEVERSADGRSFININTIKANRNDAYEAIDKLPLSNINYYRIKSVDADGKYLYSDIVSVKTSGKKGFTIYPNPVTFKKLSIDFTEQPKGDYTIKLINQSGQQLFTRSIKHDGGSSTKIIELPSYTSAGNYRIEMQSKSGRKEVLNCVIQ